MRKKIIIIVVIFVFFLSLIATYQFYPPTFNLKKGNIKLIMEKLKDVLIMI